MAEIQFPQYPVQEGPSFSSIAQRQRMLLDDAMIADQEQKARTQKVAVAGGKAFVGYDKMLQGFMQAKYANPELKFWDYAANPTTAAAYRLQGRTKIAKDIEAGVDPKDIPGMNFIERQKEGLKGVFGKDTMPSAGAEQVASAGAEEIASTGAEEAAKGGLKSTLGKVASGVGAGISIASGAQRLQSEDEMTRLGGALQVGGGVASAVALTNFWNPVGWAAAVPAAVSLGGSLIGGGSNDMLGRTPIGRARRRLNIS
jgi:hypothetical protein|tara:strand:+ start:5143 stop:5913 length:771 start_codon:yes stop_codon:yes gene_type:complete